MLLNSVTLVMYKISTQKIKKILAENLSLGKDFCLRYIEK
jgi:hypothetical protein